MQTRRGEVNLLDPPVSRRKKYNLVIISIKVIFITILVIVIIVIFAVTFLRVVFNPADIFAIVIIIDPCHWVDRTPMVRSCWLVCWNRWIGNKWQSHLWW